MRDRQQKIVEYINKVGLSSYTDLGRMFAVSPFTIRRDVDYLAQSHLLARIKGGAQRIETPGMFSEARLPKRMQINLREKELIAAKALEFIQSGDSVFLDGSSTASCLARALARTNVDITVVTNSVLIVMELSQAAGIRIVGLGGIFDSETFSFTDFESDSYASSIYIDKAFFSCTGIIPAEGTFENAVYNRKIKRHIAQRSDKVILLLDSGKFGQRALNHTFGPQEIDVLITDKKIDDDILLPLKDNNVDVHSAS